MLELNNQEINGVSGGCNCICADKYFQSVHVGDHGKVACVALCTLSYAAYRSCE